ncbi:MAG TPA: hypothetical protein VGB82_16675 [Alphaproteobacteria bacterium]
MINSDNPPPDDPASPPDPDAAAEAAKLALNEKAPAVVAMRILQQLVLEARKDPAHRTYADLDLRKMNELQISLAKNAADPSAVQWLRQMALSWNTKLRGNPALRFRRMFDLIEQVRR